MKFTMDDVRKLRAIADLCEATEPKRRAAHLGAWARKKAEQTRAELAAPQREEEVWCPNCDRSFYPDLEGADE